MKVRGVYAGGVLACVVSLWAAPAVAERPFLSAAPEIPSAATEAPCTAASTRLPPNIRVESDLLPRVRVMLRRSPTFREQCQRLADNPWVHVRVRVEPTYFERRSYRAYSVIQRPQTNLIVAIVTLQGMADPAIWVSHEFEHVIEQVEAVDLDSLADGRRQAWRSGDGMFETARAIRAGETVIDEVRDNRADHNFVE